MTGFLSVWPDCMVFFIDETGHEELAEGHHVFGMGGCAALARDLDRLIRFPWRRIRKAVTGDEDTPLHATELNSTLTTEQQALIGSFFQDKNFRRVGVASTFKTKLVGEIDLMTVIANALAKRIVEIVRWSSAPSIAVIFECNDRIAKRLEEVLGPISFRRWEAHPGGMVFHEERWRSGSRCSRFRCQHYARDGFSKLERPGCLLSQGF